jgi:hypothetical protein
MMEEKKKPNKYQDFFRLQTIKEFIKLNVLNNPTSEKNSPNGVHKAAKEDKYNQKILDS